MIYSSIEYSILLLGLDNAGKTTLLNQIKAFYVPPSTGSSSTATATISSPFLGKPSSPSPGPGDTVPTVGQNVSTISLPDLYLKIWDVGGQHSLRRLWQSYYASCHAIVFVIDSTDLGDGDLSSFSNDQVSTSSSSSNSLHPKSPRSSQQHHHHLVNDDDDENHGDKGKEAPSRGRFEECRLVLESVLQHSDAGGVPLLILANKQDQEDCVEVVRIKEGLVRKVFEGEKGGAVRDSRVLPVSALTGVGVKEAVDWVCSRVKWNKESRPPIMR